MTPFPVTPSIGLYSSPVTAPVALIVPQIIAVAVRWLIVAIGCAATREGGVVVPLEVGAIGLKGPPLGCRRYVVLIDIYMRAAHRVMHRLSVFLRIRLYGYLLDHAGTPADDGFLSRLGAFQ
jgi:hypothetical protein